METKKVTRQVRVDYAANGYIVSTRENSNQAWEAPEVYQDTAFVDVVADKLSELMGGEIVYDAELTITLTVPNKVEKSNENSRH